MTGRVKWFDDKRGYGFITSDEGRDVYVHYTAIATDGYRTLKHNWRVEYEVVTADDGREEARNVVVLPKLAPRKETPEPVQLKPRKRGKSSRR
jgi:CspA family cold shock protein